MYGGNVEEKSYGIPSQEIGEGYVLEQGKTGGKLKRSVGSFERTGWSTTWCFRTARESTRLIQCEDRNWWGNRDILHPHLGHYKIFGMDKFYILQPVDVSKLYRGCPYWILPVSHDSAQEGALVWDSMIWFLWRWCLRTCLVNSPSSYDDI